MEFNAPADLGWQALKYAARRLPDAACSAFEEQLVEDQTAREAVAQAVELSHTVAVLHASGGQDDPIDVDAPVAMSPSSEVAPRNESAAKWKWQRAAGWMSVGVAACLAIVLAAPRWLTGNSAADQAQANEQVSANWADLHNSGELSNGPPVNEVAADDAPPADDKLTADSTDEAGMVPGWLVLGVEKDSP